MIEYRRDGTHFLPELVERCHEEMTQFLRVSYHRIFPDLMFLKLASVSVAQSRHHERLPFSVNVSVVLLFLFAVAAVSDFVFVARRIQPMISPGRQL